MGRYLPTGCCITPTAHIKHYKKKITTISMNLLATAHKSFTQLGKIFLTQRTTAGKKTLSQEYPDKAYHYTTPAFTTT